MNRKIKGDQYTSHISHQSTYDNKRYLGPRKLDGVTSFQTNPCVKRRNESSIFIFILIQRCILCYYDQVFGILVSFEML